MQRAARASETAGTAAKLTRFTPTATFRDHRAALPILVRRAKRPAPDGLDELRRLVALEHEVTEAIRHAVVQGRGRGLSWAAIGHALGVTRQAARQRFSDDATMTPIDTAMTSEPSFPPRNAAFKR